jgi:hypothetical protein
MHSDKHDSLQHLACGITAMRAAAGCIAASAALSNCSCYGPVRAVEVTRRVRLASATNNNLADLLILLGCALGSLARGTRPRCAYDMLTSLPRSVARSATCIVKTEMQLGVEAWYADNVLALEHTLSISLLSCLHLHRDLNSPVPLLLLC